MEAIEKIENYKQTILTRILGHQNLVKSIVYPDSNFISKPIVDDPFSLVYSKIYPFDFLPELETAASTFITVDYEGADIKNRKINRVDFMIQIICHSSLYETDYGTTRMDYIIKELYNILFSSRGNWIGEIASIRVRKGFSSPKYNGKNIHFSLSDF